MIQFHKKDETSISPDEGRKWLCRVLPTYRLSREGPVLETLIIKLQRKAENVVKACIFNS